MRKLDLNLLTLSVLILFTAFLPKETLAQYRSAIDVQEWPAGKIVLTTGDTIYGAITFHRTEEIVNVHNSDGTLRTFSPVNVQYFIGQEQPSGRPYTFKSLPWDLGRDYSDFKKPTFFEQLNQGPVTLIMRENYFSHDREKATDVNSIPRYQEPGYYALNPDWLTQINELYYVLLPNGDIVTLHNVRKDLHKLFGKKSKSVKSYVKEHRLEYDKPHQLVAIVNYFNSLVTTAATKAAE